MRPRYARRLAALSLAVSATASAQDVAPGANREGVVHVNAIKNPEMHSYRAIVAGLDTFDELVLSRKRSDVRVWPHLRTPGLADNQRRLGDMRLECRVFVTNAKNEAPFRAVALANTGFLTSDWCSFFKDADRTWSVTVGSPLASAVLREGARTLPLRVKGHRFELPLAAAGWSDEAIVDLAYASTELPAAKGESAAP